jgi:hypothetical protein
MLTTDKGPFSGTGTLNSAAAAFAVWAAIIGLIAII